MGLCPGLRSLANLHTRTGNWMSRVKEDRPRQDGKRQDVGRSYKTRFGGFFVACVKGVLPELMPIR